MQKLKKPELCRFQQRTATLQANNHKHHLHPFSNNDALAQEGARVIEKAEGVYLYDSNGNKILDGMAGLWCVNIGYGRQELVDAATQQMQQLPYYNTFFKTTHPPAVKLAAKLAEITPEHLNQAFFTGSGSECNDTVLRNSPRLTSRLSCSGSSSPRRRRSTVRGGFPPSWE